MDISNILISGERQFINRHRPLFTVIASKFDHCEYLYEQSFDVAFLNPLVKIFNKLRYIVSPTWETTAKAFIAKSNRAERKIRQLKNKPDFVLHVFGMYAPFWNQFDIPYGMYLDYTAALANRSQPPSPEFSKWKNCERSMYARAYHLFAMSHLVKSSLIEDYGIAPEKVTVVGSFANHHPLYEGEKKFGSKQIMFNGSDFERKGGDIVLKAFKQVKQVLPEAKLVVIGKKLDISDVGVISPGKISSLDQMRELFLETDLILAPARCDPFPSFLIEAMNYGIPCIVSGNDGMPEIVDHDVSGLVIDPPVPEIIAENTINLLNNPLKLADMSQQARQKVRNQLNCDLVAKKIMQVLSSESL
jgi:glycosyltransferase involved in cell wall biosynthesis